MKSRHRLQIIAALIVGASGLACQPQNYRVEVTPGEQGKTDVRRVPLTAEEQAARERERQVRAALAAPPPEPDLAALESLWPKLSPADRAALLDQAKRAAEKQN